MSRLRSATPISDLVATRIRKLRESRGWTVRRVAEECAKLGAAQLTASALTNIERGQAESGPGKGGRPRTAEVIVRRRRREITIDELYMFAEIFGVPVDSLTTPHAECPACNGTPPTGFRCLTCGEGDQSSEPVVGKVVATNRHHETSGREGRVEY